VKVGDKWHSARIQVSKPYTGTDVEIHLHDILAELTASKNANFKLVFQQIEVYARGQASTGIYASVNQKLVLDQPETETNTIVGLTRNDTIEAEDYGSAGVIPGIRFVVTGANPVTCNSNIAEAKTNGAVLTARGVGAPGFTTAMIVVIISLRYQPY